MTKLYAVRDTIMEKNAPPFAAPTDAAAIRTFKSLNFPKESPIQDFQLVLMGEFDENKNDYPVVYQSDEPKIHIVEGNHE